MPRHGLSLAELGRLIAKEWITLPATLPPESEPAAPESDATHAMRLLCEHVAAYTKRQRELDALAERVRALVRHTDAAVQTQGWEVLASLDADTRRTVMRRLADGPPPQHRIASLSVGARQRGRRASVLVVDDPAPAQPLVVQVGDRVHVAFDPADPPPRKP